MPRQQLMSWEPAPNFRWVKMYRGVRYRVTCDELGAKARTKELSVALANAWWIKKRAEIDGPTPERAILVDEAEAGLHLRELAERGRVAQRIIESLTPEPKTATEDEIRQSSEAIIGQGSIDDERRRAELLLTVQAQVQPNVAGTKDRTVKANAENFLAVVRADMKPRSFQELKDYIRSLNNVPGLLTGETDVGAINEVLTERMYLYLRNSPLSAGAKKKRLGFWKRFVKYLWERRLIEMPRNLAGFGFEVKAKKIRTHTPAEVRAVLSGLKPRLKLYALLALNAGMTNVDIAQLTKDMVDLDRGILTRKRVKTNDNENVPTVSYRLWPRTMDLLRQHRSDHPHLFLTSMSGTPLLECRFEGEEVRRKDMIVQQWRRAKVALPLKAFRSIAATALESHQSYGRYVPHYLGHSPKSVADKHYAAPSPELFDKIMDWLRVKLLEE